MNKQFDPKSAKDAEFVARVIGALGQMMIDFHSRDLAVQNAVSEITTGPSSSGMNMSDLQHIDLVTQTHADLARFLPLLAQTLRSNDVNEHNLKGSLTLRSLQDTLMNGPLSGKDIGVFGEDEASAGDMDLF